MKMEPTKTYWRSLSDLAGQAEAAPGVDPEIAKLIENEFPEQAEQLIDPLSRRRFMQLMGASLAFAGVAGAAGCRRWEKEHIVPLARRPENWIPGDTKQYASAMELGGVAQGLLVTAFDGRPIKIEGNAQHPFSGAGSTALAQASVLQLYDPDRAKHVTRQEGGALKQKRGAWVLDNAKTLRADWVAFEDLVRDLGSKASSLKLRVLSEATSSPAMGMVRRDLANRFPNMKWHEWEALSRNNEREGMVMAFGQPLRPLYDIGKAEVVVALDADMFIEHPAALSFAHGYSQKRRPDDGVMGRLYSVESVFSTTGAVADHHLPLRSELILPFLMAVAAKLGQGTAPNAQFLSDPNNKKIGDLVNAIAEDVRANQGKAVFVVGHRQPKEVHALAAQLNAQAHGQAVSYIPEPFAAPETHVQSMSALAADLQAGTVDVLLILGGNPVFDAPADLKFHEAVTKAATSIHLGIHHNETSALCHWHLPRAHFLECWGDGLAWDGTYTVQQPIIEPIYDGRSALEVVALLAGRSAPNGRDLVKDAVDSSSQAPMGGTEAVWRKTLHDGFLDREVLQKVAPTPRRVPPAGLDARQQGGIQLQNGKLEVTFVASSTIYDGRFANNSWLQETPDFMTKATWDNVALISPATADHLGIKNFTIIEITVDDRKVKMPAYTMPGQAPYSVAVVLGGGRTRAGEVGGLAEKGIKPVGHDAYPLRASAALWVAKDATVRATGESYPVATTQDHWNIDKRGRATIEERMGDLIREATMDEFGATKGTSWQEEKYPPHNERLKVESLFDPPVDYNGDKWGMATDLSKCTGCNACVVACQSENNIPVVGKREVMRSREMNWIRIDRYFTGDIDDPSVMHQPVLCQQCENAPCEEVCPVGATVHSDEGLNDMVYNRCVGTRYCLNNCPYKVRRFNFLNYNGDVMDHARYKVRKLLFNPEVTVRSRGVMEKCTFCVQRIWNAKIPATNEGRVLKDGDIVTACQQACPTGAIVFGNLADDKSLVSKLHQSNRRYEMLEDFNTKPRNLFLARITNPNPKLAKKA